MKALVEYTDLFGGESNYSWVIRHEFDCEGMTDAQVVRHAKSLLGISGKRSNHRSFNFGDIGSLLSPHSNVYYIRM
jgi:hypothetical protein